MTEKQQKYITNRSKGERISYLRGEIIRLSEIIYPEHLAEARAVCIEALTEQVEKILRGEA